MRPGGPRASTMKERRKYSRRTLSDRRWGGERRKRDRRISQMLPDQARLAREAQGLAERRLAVRRSGIERRVIRGRVQHDRRRQSGSVTNSGERQVHARLDDNPRRVRPILGVPSDERLRDGRRRRRRLLATWVALAVLAIAVLAAVRMV